MADHTQAQMVQAVLDNLGVLAAGTTPSAEDSDLVISRMGPTLATLAAKGVGVSNDTADLNAIPDEIFLPLADIIAYSCATPFQVTSAKKSELRLNHDVAIADLTTIYRQGYTRKRLRCDHFWSRRRTGVFNFTNGT